MGKRILITCVWTVALFFGSAGAIGFASGLYFGSLVSGGSPVPESTMKVVGIFWIVGPMVCGLLGLLLGIFGVLPGTRKMGGD